MKILELNLMSFGKFSNKIINFNSSFVMIKGSNESGKTTIFKFIEGIFYGFTKPYLRSLRFSEDYYKYKPWFSEKYEGSIVFEQEENIYRIYRDFNNKDYKIFNEKSGNEISKELKGYMKSNLSFPGEYFFKCSSDIFSNSILINEKNKKINNLTTKYITDKLSEILNENSNGLSITNGINYLNLLKSKIGTNKSSQKPMGILIQNQKILKEELEKTIIQKEEYDDLILEIDNKKKEYYELKSKIKKYEEYKIYLDLETKMKLKTKIKAIKEEIEDINKELLRIPKSHTLVINDINELDEILLEIDSMQKSFNDLSKDKKYLYGKLKELELKELERNEKNKNINILKEGMKRIKFLKKLLIILTILLVFSFLSLYVLSNYIIIFLLPVLLLFTCFVTIGIIIVLNKKTETKIDELNINYNLSLNKKNVDLNNIYSNGNFIINDLSNIENEIYKMNSSIEILLNEEDFKNEQFSSLSIGIEEKTGLNYKEHLENINRINNLKMTLDEKNKELNLLTFNYDIEEILETEDIDYDNEFILLKGFDLEEARDRSDLLIKNISFLEERKNNLEKQILKLPNLIEELEKVNNSIEKNNNYLQSIDIAIEEINKASYEIKINYLPRIVIFLQDYFLGISGYDLNLKLDENLDINFNKYELADFKNIDNLSKGTIDLLNIGLKIALANEIYGKNELIIFDNSFNNLDDERIELIYDFLNNLSYERQIIILTCQDREYRITEKIFKIENIEL